MRHLPGIFDPAGFNANLSLSRNGDYDVQYFSPMLHQVLDLLGQDIRSGNPLTSAMRAFGEEFCRPTLATIMAIILISFSDQTGNQLSQPLLGPLIVQNLLRKSD